jgi:enhancing lycopene biosynthesis protein 2
MSGCASFDATSIQRIADQIIAVQKAGVDAFCGLPPNLQARALKLLRKRAPAANIMCQSIVGGPMVTGVPGW